MSWLIAYSEILGTISGFVCVWLIVRQSAWNWPIGLVTNFFFLFVLAQERLYANVVLQLIFIVLGFYGWYMWLFGGKNRTQLPVSRMNPKSRVVVFFLWVVRRKLVAVVVHCSSISGHFPALA